MHLVVLQREDSVRETETDINEQSQMGEAGGVICHVARSTDREEIRKRCVLASRMSQEAERWDSSRDEEKAIV